MAITFDAIGAQNFDRLEGDLSAQGMQVEEITRPGVRGRAFRELEKRGEPVTLSGIVCVSSQALADALLDSYKAYQGTVKSVTKTGITRTNFLVLNVEVTERKNTSTRVGGVLGGSGSTGVLVTSRWQLVYVGIT